MSDRTHTSHYCKGNIECIDYIADQRWMLGFCLGNIVKYATRLEHKGQPIEDLDKIINYATMLKDHMEKAAAKRETNKKCSVDGCDMRAGVATKGKCFIHHGFFHAKCKEKGCNKYASPHNPTGHCAYHAYTHKLSPHRNCATPGCTSNRVPASHYCADCIAGRMGGVR